MGKIFRYLWESKGAVLGIILLLIIQAFCDLSLPQYTSDIVDVGIQQGGVEHVAMEEMRPETYEGILLFMEEGDTALFEDSYEQNAEGNYERVAKDKDTLEKLDASMSMPLLILSALSQSDGMDLDTVRQMLASGMTTKEEIMKMAGTQVENLGDMSDSILQQSAVLAVQQEYKALGLDLSRYQTNYLLVTGAKMLGITLLMSASAVLAGLMASFTSAKVGRDLRSRIFQKVVSFSHAELDQFSTASLITRSTNDIQQIQMVCVLLLRMVLYAPILGIGGVIRVASTKTGMGWIIGLAVGTIMVLVAVLVGVAMPKFKVMQTLVDKLNLVSREILTGVPVIRAFSREKHEEERFARANRDLMRTQLFTNRVMTVMMPAMMLIMNGITVLIVWMGAKGIDMGNLQVGDMMAFITYTMQIVMSFLMLTMISVMLPRAGVAANRIDEVLRVEPMIRDKEETMDDAKEDWKGVVSFEDVSFRYPGADEDALSHIQFTAEPGKTTAIIGSTGCGKSTLLHLIPRFYDVTGGRITIDGVDIRDLSQHKLRSLLGFVPQKGVLFSGTIASNIKFAGEGVSDGQMVEAAKIAQAEEFILKKEETYESPIAQGGTNVSDGQKQRLSIARAIARQPRVFLFDDSFSALDYKTDAALRRALSEKVKDATVIIVAQRISTILHADQILVLDEGRIVGQGTHEELLKTCGTYQEIARSQLSEAELNRSPKKAGTVPPEGAAEGSRSPGEAEAESRSPGEAEAESQSPGGAEDLTAAEGGADHE